jgi:hypothetical protein
MAVGTAQYIPARCVQAHNPPCGTFTWQQVAAELRR